MKQKRYRVNKRGQSILIVVIFLMLISATITLGLLKPVLAQIRIESNLYNSRGSYFLAEAGVEDVLYRIRNSIAVSPTETMTLDGESVITTVTDTATGKTILGDASFKDFERKTEVKVIIGVGASFNYGVQVGNGGFVFGQNAVVNGNVYANGNITGGNGSRITGTAIAANSIALTTDQANDSPSTPPNEIVFGRYSSTQDVAQSFQVSTTTVLNKVDLYLKKNSNPSNATVRIVTDSSGSPSTNNLTTGTLSAGSVGTAYAWIAVTFSSNPQLVAGTTYWIVVDSGVSSSKYYTLAANTSYGSGQAKSGEYGSTWGDTAPSGLDGYFQVYLGGLTSTINDMRIGSSTSGVGDARAHRVNNSTVYGNLYCQTGSGNNKSCDTSQSDPVPTAFPISEANITQWKAEASSGGIRNGNFTWDTNGVSTSTGPLEITGNVLIDNSAIWNITGTIWVHGDVTFDNLSVTKLDPSYGTDSAVIIADGKVEVRNNANFDGSGTPGSYPMLITTSDCPTSSSCGGDNAIDIRNNAGVVILNAQSGTLKFYQNSGAKQATAKTISLENGAEVTYETGLADINFSSGPGGAWNVVSWKEVE